MLITLYTYITYCIVVIKCLVLYLNDFLLKILHSIPCAVTVYIVPGDWQRWRRWRVCTICTISRGTWSALPWSSSLQGSSAGPGCCADANKNNLRYVSHKYYNITFEEKNGEVCV